MNELPIDEPTSVLEFLAFPPQINSYLELGVRCGRTIFRVSKLVDKAIGVDLSFQNLNIRKSNNIFFYEISGKTSCSLDLTIKATILVRLAPLTWRSGQARAVYCK